MRDIVRSLGGLVVASVLGVGVLLWIGVVDLRFPWSLDVTSETKELALPERVEIVRVEPINLDCRARITAHVPVEGRKEHRLFGQVYRTDALSLRAIGDIDTCVDAGATEVLTAADGATRVLVPAEAVRFVRPRVDAVATMGSVDFDKGMLGKLTDALPWVDDSEGLTAAGYAFAQETIGSSECMSAAFEETISAIEDAYRGQAIAKGLDPTDVAVSVTGVADFDQHPPTDLEGFGFEVTDGVSCRVAAADAVTRRP